jgi:hypothetical protein
LKAYEKALAIGAGVAGVIAFGLLVRPAAAKPSGPATLFFHIKNDPVNGPVTQGKVAKVYSDIANVAGRAGFSVGFQPQCITDWATQLTYLQEFSKIPVMLTVFSSDNNYQINVAQIAQAMAVCPVKYLRFHEVMSYYASTINTAAVQNYIQSILIFSKAYGIPLFWNEWDPSTYPAIQTIIQGYEDNVLVSFGTNNGNIEPVAGYQLLQVFRRKAVSVQSWYWWERNGRINGYELTMSPELMAQFTLQAFQAGCEIVQYEPYSYFFDSNANPVSSLYDMFAAMVTALG